MGAFAYYSPVNSITTSFGDPTSDGGSPILYYVVSATYNGKRTCTVAFASINTCSIDYLPGGRRYTVRVRAVNAKGAGPADISTAYIPPGPA